MVSFSYKTACIFLLTVILWLPNLALASNEFAETAAERSLKWKIATVSVSIPKTGLAISNIPAESFRDAITAAASTWSKAAPVEFRFRETDAIGISPSGLKGDGISIISAATTDENLKLFADGADSLPASTRVFFDKLGNITEADIALNPYVQFSTDGAFGTYDLEAVLMHEFGHLLGIEHSASLSSRMYESIPKNSLLSSDRFALRQLSAGDVAEVRGKYGERSDVFDCCTSVSGSIDSTSGVVWMLDKESGRVVASTVVDSSGRFSFSGISEGSYVVMAQGSSDAFRVGESVTEIGSPIRLKKALQPPSQTLSTPRYIGVRGQLSTSAIRLVAGQTERVFLGVFTKEMEGEFSIGLDSEHLQTVPGSFFSNRFNRDITSLSTDLKVSPETPPGSYNIFLQNSSGSRRYLVGAIEVISPQAAQ